MTDEELGDRLIDASKWNLYRDRKRLGAAARTFLAARPEVTREAMAKFIQDRIGSNMQPMALFVDSHIAALSHFAPPPAPPPISGMSVEEWETEIVRDFNTGRTGFNADVLTPEEGNMAEHAARVAHRLAQPAPDPDAVAKAAQRAYTEDFFPDDEHMRPTWERISEQERNGWRRAVATVAAAKERGE